MKVWQRFGIGILLAGLVLTVYYQASLGDLFSTISDQEQRVQTLQGELTDAKVVAAAQPALAECQSALQSQAEERRIVSVAGGTLTPALTAVLKIVKDSGGRVDSIHPGETGKGFAVRFFSNPNTMQTVLKNLDSIPANLVITEFDLKMTDQGLFDSYLKFEVVG